MAILCLKLSTVTALPLASLPASAPGFGSGAAPAVHDPVREPWIDKPDSDLAPVAVTVPVPNVIEEESEGEGEDEDEDGDESNWELEPDHFTSPDDLMSKGGMGNAIAETLNSSSSTTPPKLGTLTLPESLLASLSRLFSLGFWKTLLGSFLVFWTLIASTVACLLVVAIRVRRLERSSRLAAVGARGAKDREAAAAQGRGRRCRDGDDDGDDDDDNE